MKKATKLQFAVVLASLSCFNASYAQTITSGVFVGDLTLQPNTTSTPQQLGNLTINGQVDIYGNLLKLGSAGSITNPALVFTYTDDASGTNSAITTTSFRNSLSWRWQQNSAGGQRSKMFLDNNNRLSLFDLSGVSKIVLDPIAGNITVNGQSLLQPNSFGNVGIGLSSPTARLSVRGAGSGSGLLASFTDSADTPRFSILDNGRIGIGTTSPSQQLEITGNFRLPVTTNSASGVIFSGGDRIFHTFGNDNLFLGKNAGNFTTTGQANVGLGSRTLDSLTTGSSNFAIGTDVLGDLTTGAFNTGIGTLSLQRITTAHSNIAVGAEALRYTTTSWANVAIGMYALSNFNAGAGTAIGYGAGQVTNGYGPTFAGYFAGRGITTGQFNTALGWQAMHTDGVLSSTNGNYRTALGAGAQVTADNTVVIGGVGQFAANTILGGTAASAKLHVIKTAEQLRIGYDVANYYSTNVTSLGKVNFDAIGADSSFVFADSTFFPESGIWNQSGNVGIGTTAPSERLEVVGNVKVTGIIRCAPGGDIPMFTGN